MVPASESGKPNLFKVAALVLVSFILLGYVFGRATSPNYNSVGGELAFRRYVAVQSDLRDITWKMSLTDRGEAAAIDADKLTLSIACGTTARVFDEAKGEVTAEPVGYALSAAIPMKGPEFIQAVGLVAGGVQAYSMPAAFRSASAVWSASETIGERVLKTFAFGLVAGSGFWGGWYFGYSDGLNCIEQNFQRNLADVAFWKGVAAIKKEQLGWRIRYGTPPSPDGDWKVTGMKRLEHTLSRQTTYTDEEQTFLAMAQLAYEWRRQFVDDRVVWVLDKETSSKARNSGFTKDFINARASFYKAAKSLGQDKLLSAVTPQLLERDLSEGLRPVR